MADEGALVFANWWQVTGRSRRPGVQPATHVNGSSWPHCVPRRNATIATGTRLMQLAWLNLYGTFRNLGNGHSAAAAAADEANV
jgi:hypothetical protein